MENRFNITKEVILEIMSGVAQRMQVFSKLRKEYDLYLSNKNISEIIGKLMEKVAADTFTKHLGYEVKKAGSDKDPDLFFTKINLPLEIKMTSTETAWTGGEFSQRPFDYLLVSWGGENYDEYFVCFVHLEKDDWKSNMSKHFYGPSLTARIVCNKNERMVLLGSFQVSDKGAVKIKREKINAPALNLDKWF